MSNPAFNELFITRHRDLINLEKLSTPITVVGAGAIGGFTVLSLAKMGFFNITVIDFDTVENENIGAQFFAISSIGKPKVDALKEMVLAFTGIEIRTENRKITAQDPFYNTGIVICAVDNMEVRKIISERFNCSYIIDPRMGAEYATLNVAKMSDTESYMDYTKTLFTDGEAVHERCTAKTTIYTVLLISGQVVKAVKDIIMDKPYIASMDWSIRDNALVSFSNEGVKL